MHIEDHLLKDIKFLKSPNFNNRPEEKNISLIVVHSISLPPKEYGGNHVESFFLNKLWANNQFKDSQITIKAPIQ